MTPLLAIVLAASGAGQPASHTLFTCSLGRKTAQISAVGDSLFYRYGAPKRPELTITGGPGIGNVFWMRQAMSGAERQMRFHRRGYNYILFSVDANARTGTKALSGLVVMKGQTRISYQTCRNRAWFADGYDYDALRPDTAEYSAP